MYVCVHVQLVQHEQQLATMQVEFEQKDKLSEGLQFRLELQQSKVRNSGLKC